MSGIEIKSYRFRKEREASWLDLETLLGKVEKQSLGALSAAELAQLPALYRSVLASLSVARGISLDRNLRVYLENLASRAYLCVYGVHRSFREALSLFVLRRFPQEARRNRGAVALSAALLLLGVCAGFLLTVSDVDNYYMMITPDVSQGRTPTSTPEELREILYQEGTLSDFLLAFATFLFTHNAKIGILCFALGFALGIPVFYLLFANGAMLGAMGALHLRAGLSIDFWGWILPHGLTELTAVVFCGAGGLMLARAIVFPGRHSRLQNLKLQGRRAGILVLGAVGMFAVAAVIEGLFRQMVQDVPLRYMVAVASGVAWMLYFLRVGRSRDA